MQDWQEVVKFVKKYSQFREEFVDILSKFQTTRDGNLGHNIVAKYRIERLNENLQPVHSAPYCAGPMTREFEKTKIYKSVEQKVIKPEFTE